MKLHALQNNIMENLFIYGTLRDPKVQMSILGHVLSTQKDVLVGYSKKQIEISGKLYPIAFPDNTSRIRGKVVEVAKKELDILDKYETKAYKRTKARLVSNKIVWVYHQPN